MDKRIEEAVKRESTSKDYALEYYEAEKELLDGLFSLDTEFLDSLFTRKGKLFDATMGRGRHVIHFAKRGFEVFGNDYNRNMVELVRKDLNRLKLKARLYNHNITDLSRIKDNSFDYVISMGHSLGCIPKIKNREKAVKEFARVVKPDGLVVVHGHNIFGDISLEDVLPMLKCCILPGSGLEPRDMIYFHSKNLGHTFIHYFSLNELHRLFAAAGLKIQKKAGLNWKQNGYYRGPLKSLMCGGFIFVGKK